MHASIHLMTVAVLLTAIALAACTVFFARRRSGYSHVRQTISELGERGAPDGRRVSLAVFLPVGLVLAVVASMQPPASATAGLAAALSVGYVGAALFPCDPGSPLHGSARQALHNLAGGVEYVGGGLALWRLGEVAGPVYSGLAVMVAANVVFLSLATLATWRGLVQRIGELALFAGLALSCA